jgi:stage IV sporulation protein FB
MNIFKNIKLFNFMGSPVNLGPLFLILFLFLGPIEVISIFISVLVHEMAHAFVANRRGYLVKSINVGLFFGTAEIDISNIHERDSIPITFAGPLSNLLLFVFFLFLSPLFLGTVLEPHLLYFLFINLILFVFNLIPIYPLDGGRILKDSLYLLLKDRKKSKKISAWVSLILSISLIIFSIITTTFVLAFFMGLFAYQSLKDLDFVK